MKDPPKTRLRLIRFFPIIIRAHPYHPSVYAVHHKMSKNEKRASSCRRRLVQPHLDAVRRAGERQAIPDDLLGVEVLDLVEALEQADGHVGGFGKGELFWDAEGVNAGWFGKWEDRKEEGGNGFKNEEGRGELTSKTDPRTTVEWQVFPTGLQADPPLGLELGCVLAPNVLPPLHHIDRVVDLLALLYVNLTLAVRASAPG